MPAKTCGPTAQLKFKWPDSTKSIKIQFLGAESTALVPESQ